jgi:phosphoglycolate phosphatase
MKRKSLFLFDLDGVLLDSRANMQAAWASVQRECAIDLPFERYFALIGRPMADILAELGLSARAQEVEKRFRIASSAVLHSAPLFAGVEPTLVALEAKGARLGVVTSKDWLRGAAVLARIPVEFAAVQTPDARYRGKPAPDHLLVAMAEARCDPADTLYVGDMAVDAEAAARAGVDYAHARWGYGAPPCGEHLSLGRFDELLALAP